MLKRFYSKKSGFTLAEIIIAFAIFSIMAAMIVQILDLAVTARRSNNVYQQELAEQERLLTLIQRTNKDYAKEQGLISFTLNGNKVELPYDMLSADKDAEYAAEGLNYFIANVNYQASGEFSPSAEAGGADDAGSNSGSQASRMDTRLTGTGGIGYITVQEVIKDTTVYADDSPYKVPAGHTRYFFRVSASYKDIDDNETLAGEDVNYSQYRLFFYDDAKLNAAASSVRFTDDKKQTYTTNIPQTLTISRVGYVKANVSDILANGGLTSENFTTETDDVYNPYTVQRSGENAVRVAALAMKNYSYVSTKFEANKYCNFYVDFVGTDVTLTTASFGHNGEKVTGTGDIDLGYRYAACPMYKELYDDDGTPEYPVLSSDIKSLGNYVNIYGANLYERNYNVTETPDDGGDDE